MPVWKVAWLPRPEFGGEPMSGLRFGEMGGTYTHSVAKGPMPQLRPHAHVSPRETVFALHQAGYERALQHIAPVPCVRGTERVSLAQLDVTLDRPLPQAPDAERAVLGAVLEGGGERIMLRLHRTTTEHFYKDGHRLIWDAMAWLTEERTEIDLLTLKHELTKRGQLEQAGGSAYVSSLTDVVPDIANVERYAAILEREAKKRAILVAANKAMRSALDPEDEPEQTIAALFAEVGEQATPQKMQATPIWEVAAETAAKMSELRTRDVAMSLPTTWETFERLQIFIPTLAILAGHSKQGKSGAMVALADDLAKKGSPTVIFSLESRKQELSLRHMSMTTRINHSRMRDWRTFGDSDHEKMREYTREISSRKLYIEDGMRAAEDIVLELRRLKAVHGIKAAFVDYIQNVELRRRVDNREERLHEISKMFLNAANDLEVHITALSQLRDGAGVEGKRYTIDDLAYAKSIARSARIVTFISRPAKINPLNNSGGESHVDYRSLVHMDVQVEANNEGQTGDFVAQFDEIRQRVWEGTCEKPCMHEKCSRQQADVAKQNRLY